MNSSPLGRHGDDLKKQNDLLLIVHFAHLHSLVNWGNRSTERWDQRRRQTAKHLESPSILCFFCIKWKMWVFSSVPSRREMAWTAALCPLFGVAFSCDFGGDGARACDSACMCWRQSKDFNSLRSQVLICHILLAYIKVRTGPVVGLPVPVQCPSL